MPGSGIVVGVVEGCETYRVPSALSANTGSYAVVT